MKFLILGKTAGDPTSYRGVDRQLPSYVVEEDDDSEINQLFYWSTRIHTEKYLSDVQKGMRLIDLYAERNPPHIYEMVEITSQNEAPETGTQLLGFDIVTGTSSILGNGMRYCETVRNRRESERLKGDDLLCLIEKYFQPRLNQHYLFDDYETASDCLNCHEDLTDLVPYDNYWDMSYTACEVVGVYAVDIDRLR